MDKSAWAKKIGWFLLIMTAFILLGNLTTMLIFNWFGIEIDLLTGENDFTNKHINVLKWTSTITHIIIFTFSSLLWTFLFFKNKYFTIKKVDAVLVLYFIGWLLLSFPLIAYAAQLNFYIPLPSWAEEIDQSTMGFLMEMLKMDGLSDLLINIIVIALVPAIGEELLFRGVVLRELMKGMKNGHLAVLITSLLFAFFHFQLHSFLPKFAIGMILSYSYFWTKNLWYPIIIHFFNNAFQVLVLYTSSEQLNDIDEEVIPQIPILSVIISAILCAVVVDAIIKRIKTSDERV